MSTLLRGATLIDGIADAPLVRADVLIQGDRFAAVGPEGSFAAPPDATVVDLAGRWLLPGMIDLHVHPYWPKGGLSETPVHEGTAFAALQAASNLRTALCAGITTARDVGPNGDIGVGLRRAVTQGVVQGSRIYTCVRFISQTGGHGGELEADRRSSSHSRRASRSGPVPTW